MLNRELSRLGLAVGMNGRYRRSVFSFSSLCTSVEKEESLISSGLCTATDTEILSENCDMSGLVKLRTWLHIRRNRCNPDLD